MAITRSRDAVPEHQKWADKGCSISPRCTACPLPVCRYEVHGGLRAVQNFERDKQIVRLLGEINRSEIAERFGISLRTVHRVMKDYIEGRLEMLQFIEDADEAEAAA